MASKPSYLGTLNAIANGERIGHQLFTKWAAKTEDDKLRSVLSTVAIREAEHSWAFEKRLCELGYPLQPTSNKGLTKLLRLMGSGASDEEKFHAFGIGIPGDKQREAGPDDLLSLLSDRSIDPATGTLLGRFICEERDSGRLLTNAYRAMKRRGSAARRTKSARAA